jgi:hypothetical protein
MKLSNLVITTLLSLYASAGFCLMTPEEIVSYQRIYDNEYQKNLNKGQSLAQSYYDAGKSPIEIKINCHSQRTLNKEMVKNLDKGAPNYYDIVASLDGEGDGKREGCLAAIKNFKPAEKSRSIATAVSVSNEHNEEQPQVEQFEYAHERYQEYEPYYSSSNAQ